jgi:PPOX class probable F420-dependent enzyme
MIGWKHDFISSHRVARLATVDEHGQPHVVPIVYAFDGARLYTPLDAKPKRVEVNRLQRVKNIESNPQVAIIIDDYAEDWTQLAWVQIRGTASIIEHGDQHVKGVVLLQNTLNTPQCRWASVRLSWSLPTTLQAGART